MSKNKINSRRDRTSSLLIQGYTETKISEILDVSRQTVLRDVKFLKKASQSWLDGLAKDGFIFEYKLCLDKVKERERKLQQLVEDEKDSMKVASLIRTLNSCTKLYAELLDAAPTIHSIKKSLEENGPV